MNLSLIDNEQLFLDDINEAIQGYLQLLSPNAPSYQTRMWVYEYVQNILNGFGNSKVFLYGSVPLLVYLPDSDIDIGASVPSQYLDQWFDWVVKILKSQQIVRSVSFISQAKVKLVKCRVGNIVLDISANMTFGKAAVCFFEEVNKAINTMMEVNDLYKKGFLLVKSWCVHESGIVNSNQGYLSSYALQILVLYIVNTFHASINTPFQIFCHFLAYYSNFDFASECLSVEGPIPLKNIYNGNFTPIERSSDEPPLLPSSYWNECASKWANFFKPKKSSSSSSNSQETKEQKREQPAFPSKFFNILDPLDNANNCANSVSKENAVKIQSVLKEAWSKMHDFLRKLDNLYFSSFSFPPSASSRTDNRSVSTAGASTATRSNNIKEEDNVSDAASSSRAEESYKIKAQLTLMKQASHEIIQLFFSNSSTKFKSGDQNRADVATFQQLFHVSTNVDGMDGGNPTTDGKHSSKPPPVTALPTSISPQQPIPQPPLSATAVATEHKNNHVDLSPATTKTDAAASKNSDLDGDSDSSQQPNDKEPKVQRSCWSAFVNLSRSRPNDPLEKERKARAAEQLQLTQQALRLAEENRRLKAQNAVFYLEKMNFVNMRQVEQYRAALAQQQSAAASQSTQPQPTQQTQQTQQPSQARVGRSHPTRHMNPLSGPGIPSSQSPLSQVNPFVNRYAMTTSTTPIAMPIGSVTGMNGVGSPAFYANSPPISQPINIPAAHQTLPSVTNGYFTPHSPATQSYPSSPQLVPYHHTTGTAVAPSVGSAQTSTAQAQSSAVPSPQLHPIPTPANYSSGGTPNLVLMSTSSAPLPLPLKQVNNIPNSDINSAQSSFVPEQQP